MISMFFINTLVISTAVIIHYEVLSRISQLMPTLSIRFRYRIVVAIFGALIAHAIEIWVFAFVYYAMSNTTGLGYIEGISQQNLMDCAYFSIVNYTSLGYGDVIPVGPVRFLAGLEALTGLVLIGWTSSFMFFQMRQYWKKD